MEAGRQTTVGGSWQQMKPTPVTITRPWHLGTDARPWHLGVGDVHQCNDITASCFQSQAHGGDGDDDDDYKEKQQEAI